MIFLVLAAELVCPYQSHPFGPRSTGHSPIMKPIMQEHNKNTGISCNIHISTFSDKTYQTRHIRNSPTQTYVQIQKYQSESFRQQPASSSQKKKKETHRASRMESRRGGASEHSADDLDFAKNIGLKFEISVYMLIIQG